MQYNLDEANGAVSGIVNTVAKVNQFRLGGRVRGSVRCSIGHYRMQIYPRGKTRSVKAVIKTAAAPQHRFPRALESLGYLCFRCCSPQACR